METREDSLSSKFAGVYGSPGEAPRVMGLLRAFWPLLLVCLVTGYLLRALLPSPVLSLSHIGILFFLVAVVAGVLLAWGDRRLGNYLKGWLGYFGFTETRSMFKELDSWIRRRLRSYVWKQWGRRGYKELRKRGVSRTLAWNTAKSAHGPWRISRSPALTIALGIRYFTDFGLPLLYKKTLW